MVKKNVIWGQGRELTHASHDLSLHAILILESACEVTDSTTSIARYIRYLSDVIEHMPTCEQEDSNQAYSSPQIAILNHRRDVRIRHGDECKETQYNRDSNSDSCVIDGAGDGGIVLSTWEVAKQPAVNAFCGLRAEEIEADGLAVRLCMRADGGREVE